MRSSAALFAALLLLASGVVTPLSAGAQLEVTDAGADGQPSGPAPNVVTVQNTTNYLSIPDEDDPRRGSARVGLDVSAAVAADAQNLSTQYARTAFRRGFDNASTDAERAALLRSYADRLERREQALERQNNATIRSFANGTLSARAMTRERARIHAEANEHQAFTNWIQGASKEPRDYAPPDRLDLRLENVRWRFEQYQGLVSERINRISRADSFGQTTYVESSATGYTLATVNETDYVRETYLGSERDEDALDQFAAADDSAWEAFSDRQDELYPWVYATADDRGSKHFGDIGVYRYTLGFPDGQITTLLDGGTTNAFHESIWQAPDSVPVTETVTETNETLRVTLNRTYETGPMEVSVERNTTDVAVSANVTLNGQNVGETGADGSTWIVEPRRPYTLNVTAESGGNVTVPAPDPDSPGP